MRVDPVAERPAVEHPEAGRQDRGGHQPVRVPRLPGDQHPDSDGDQRHGAGDRQRELPYPVPKPTKQRRAAPGVGLVALGRPRGPRLGHPVAVAGRLGRAAIGVAGRRAGVPRRARPAGASALVVVLVPCVPHPPVLVTQPGGGVEQVSDERTAG
ncbi:hypothetical protein GCM10023321_73200 [Pseudonocardia eucalypti]|uniref:Uncharacterized protein n=1 Tax=Pseudonocardia eucalypti TaxID=648755 RepID=A0ABP9R7U6_9PSEU